MKRVKRPFTKKIAVLAAAISNDISEDIDNGQSRHAHRIAVAWWADQAEKQAQKAASLQTRLSAVLAGLAEVHPGSIT